MRAISKQEHGEERVDCTVKEGWLQGGEGGQAKSTSKRKHERVSGRKSSPGGSGESSFHSKSEMWKRGWKTKGSLIQ